MITSNFEKKKRKKLTSKNKNKNQKITNFHF